MKQIHLFTPTMSTVEIAELTGKRHDNVMRKAKELSEKGIICAPQIEERYGNNNLRFVYRLNKVESLNLVANLCPEFTAKIIDRWLQLEALQNPSFASKSVPTETININKDRYIALLESENELLKTKPKRKTRAPVPLSPSEKHQILHLAQRGLGNTAIAKQIGRSRSAVRAVVREGGVQ